MGAGCEPRPHYFLISPYNVPKVLIATNSEDFMVQLSIVVFFGLFAAVEIYQSVKNVQLPMPVYLVLGILLAVASNASSRFINTSTTEEPSALHGQK
jgi:uncharacterized membrane protein